MPQNPEDGRGWEVIAPVYLRLGRAERSGAGLSERDPAARLDGGAADGLGEAILAAEGGIVTAEARAAFEAANALDPAAPGPRFYLGAGGRAGGQAGARRRTLGARFSRRRRPMRPGAAAVETALARGARRRDGAAWSDARSRSRPRKTCRPAISAAMIEGMVSGLAARLKDEPDDVEGWLRLIRSYVGARPRRRRGGGGARRARRRATTPTRASASRR